jgi:hypothetical protein
MMMTRKKRKLVKPQKTVSSRSISDPGASKKTGYSRRSSILAFGKLLSNISSFIIIILYVVSFIMENRSSDLNLMKQALKPYILNKTLSTGNSKSPKYDQISDLEMAFVYMNNQIMLLLVESDEPLPDKTFYQSVFADGQHNDTYSYIQWRPIQTYNLYMGARLTIAFTPPKMASRSSVVFFSSNMDGAVANSVLVGLETSRAALKLKAEDFQFIKFELLFYNYNIETAAHYTFNFENTKAGFKKSLDEVLFMPRANDFMSAYFWTQAIVWVIRTIYLVTFIYFVFNFIQELILILSKSSIEIRENLSFWYVIYIVYTVVNIKYFIDYSGLLLSPVLFKATPIENSAQFDTWKLMGTNQKSIMVLNGILTILLITRIMEMLSVRFRSVLTLVFYSFVETSEYLVSYFIVDIVLHSPYSCSSSIS